MDAFELTHPVLTSSRGTRPSAPERPTTAADDREEQLRAARRFVNQLPLGLAPGPPFAGRRRGPADAGRAVERALWAVAVRHGVPIGVDEAPALLARRLVRQGAIVAPAGDAVLALLPLVETADYDESVAKLAGRLVGYLGHRASGGGR